MSSYHLSHLSHLEHEAIYIIREAAAQFERGALLFSGGKDSIVLVHLAVKAFAPAKPPFPLLHIDTGRNFPEVLAYRDELVARLGLRLLVGSVEEAIRTGLVAEEKGPLASRNTLQIPTLLHAIATHQFDACLGGARRDEEKARAKERVFSHRDEFGQWDPRHQRAEVWQLYNGRKHPGEHFRIFPLSNWTEADVWSYLEREGIPVPSIYFSHERAVFRRQGALLAVSPDGPPPPDAVVERRRVRYRTVGDLTCTGAIESEAATLREIIAEVLAARTSERGSRMDDRRSECAMEDRKRAGYF